MTAGWRKAALAAHIAVSVGWLGAVLAYVPLDVAAATSDDEATLRAAYVGMDLVARGALVPLALATLASGLVVSLGTSWGLFRHWWVVVSLLLTTAATLVLLAETRVIASHAAAASGATTAAQLQALGSTLPHSFGGLLVLLVVLGLNVFKPRGLTRHGWRRQRDETRART